MSWTVALALAALVVSIVVLYRSLTTRRRPNPEVEELRRRNQELRRRLERAERHLGIDGDEPSLTPDQKDRA